MLKLFEKVLVFLFLEFRYVTRTKHKGRNRDPRNRNRRRSWTEAAMRKNVLKVLTMNLWRVGLGWAGRGRVSVVSAGVNPIPEHSYGGEVVSDAGVVLNVVEPPCHVHILLLLLDGQVHLGEKGGGGGEVDIGTSMLYSMRCWLGKALLLLLHKIMFILWLFSNFIISCLDTLTSSELLPMKQPERKKTVTPQTLILALVAQTLSATNAVHDGKSIHLLSGKAY